MPANPNWARWVFASVATYLTNVAKDANLPVLVEGLEERSNHFMAASDRLEVRITGPFTRELSRDYFKMDVSVNVLLSSRFDGPAKNRYEFARLAGIFHEAMDCSIAVYKYGNQPEDDQAFIGCLLPVAGKNDAIRVFHFGQVNTTDPLRQSMVDARYVMDIYDHD